MIKLVAIRAVEGGISYSRYDGSKRTHNGVAPEALSAAEVEHFRMSGSAA